MKPTVLLAEDDKDSREALALLLTLEGHQVITACDGIAAFELANKHMPELIITDICMPGWGGIELTRNIRTASNTAHIPVIAITAASEVMRANVLAAGASACLAKPIELNSLLHWIECLLASNSAAASKIA
jgi:CheY-like chemotaxis protein